MILLKKNMKQDQIHTFEQLYSLLRCEKMFRTHARSSYFLLALLVCISIGYLGNKSLAPLKHNVDAQFLKHEQTHAEAAASCTRDHQSLPSLPLLVRMARAEQLPHAQTDYWSSWTVGSFAFGWSTKTGVLSFDSQGDQDHVVCVSDETEGKN